MGNHRNYKEEKCWSCAFFCGNRKESTGFILGNSVETSSSGKCSCSNSPQYNRNVFDDYGGCSRYQRWAGIDTLIAKQEKEKFLKEQRKENEYLLDEQRRQEESINREKEKLERERRRLKEERKRLEYERWYSSLSPEEQKAEDKRNEEERIHRERLEKEESRKFNILRINGEIHTLKVKPIKISIIGFLITLIPFLLGWFPYYAYSEEIEVNEKFLKESIDYADDPVYKMFYDETIELKEQRACSIWIPITILFVGILITALIFWRKYKKNKGKIADLKRELNNLEKVNES